MYEWGKNRAGFNEHMRSETIRHRHTFKCFAALNEIQLDQLDADKAQTIFTIIEQEALRIEHKFSRYRLDSVVSLINDAAGKKACSLDPETAMLLAFAELAFKTSSGLFDITSGVLRRVWDFKQGRIPTSERIDEVLPLVGWEKVKLNKKQIYLPEPGMEIDLGGIGKEYAVDRAAELAFQHGAKHCCINFGGDLRVTGPRGDGRPWSVAIQHPRVKGGVIASVPLSQGALATSGDYERYIEVDGKRYCHLLNPKTGWPVEHLQSVSVIADTCLNAGFLASATMLLGAKGKTELLDQTGLSYLIATSKGEILSSTPPRHRAQ